MFDEMDQGTRWRHELVGWRALVGISVLALLASLLIVVGPPSASAAPADPDATVDVPGFGQDLQGTPPFVLSGQAFDDTGVVRTAVAIRNPVDNTWLHPDGVWRGGFAWTDSVMDAPGDTTVNWTFPWTPPRNGTYGMTAQAWDAGGNLDTQRQWVQFTVSAGPPPPTTTTTSTSTTTTSTTSTTTTTTTMPPGEDTTAPTAAVTVPASNQAFGEGPITFRGTASDDVGVAGVDVAVQDISTREWLHADGTWGSFIRLAGDVAVPGASFTNWSHEFSPAAAGNYGLLARARDVSGNIGSNVWERFTSAGPGGGGGGECTSDAPPYAVGEMTVNLVDTSRGRSFQTTIYYPAATGGAGASVSCGPFPMVMVGHGGSGTGTSAANLFRFLVSDGYVVVGPTFPAGFEFEALAGDVSFVLTEVLGMRSGNGPMAQLDGANIGFIGTSKGASIGYAMYLDCCVDPRIDAVIPRAGFMPGDTFDYANGPALLILNGDADEFAPWSDALAFYNAANAPKGIIRLAGVGHDLNVGPHGILQDAPRGFFDFILKGEPSGANEILQSVSTNPIASIQFDW